MQVRNQKIKSALVSEQGERRVTPNSSGFGSYELSFSTKSTLLLQSLTRVCKIRNTRLAALHLQLEREHFAGKSIFSSTLPLGKTYSSGKAQDNSKTRLGIQLWQRWVFEYPDPNPLLDRSAITALSCFTPQLTASTVCSFAGSNIWKFALSYQPWIMVMPEKISPNFYASSHFYKHQAFAIQQSNCF